MTAKDKRIFYTVRGRTLSADVSQLKPKPDASRRKWKEVLGNGSHAHVAKRKKGQPRGSQMEGVRVGAGAEGRFHAIFSAASRRHILPGGLFVAVHQPGVPNASRACSRGNGRETGKK